MFVNFNAELTKLTKFFRPLTALEPCLMKPKSHKRLVGFFRNKTCDVLTEVTAPARLYEKIPNNKRGIIKLEIFFPLK